jgi:hypothetical protein
VREILPGIVRDEVTAYLEVLFGGKGTARLRRGRPAKQ